MKRFSSSLSALLGLALLLAGCRNLPEHFAQARPLQDGETAEKLEILAKGLKSSTGGIYRYSADLKVENEDASHSLAAMCLWQPGQKVRWRFRYLGHTLFSALGLPECWLLYFEDQGAVYVCPAAKLATLQSAEIPRGVWQLLERSRRGFLPENRQVRGYALEEALLIEEETLAYKSWLSFDASLPPLPQQAVFEGPKGRIRAIFTRPEEIGAQEVFLPMTNGYKVIKL